MHLPFFFCCCFFLPKDTFFFFYIAPLLDFYRTGISCFKIDHVLIIHFKLIFKEVFFFCVLYQIFKVFPYFEIDHVSFNSCFESFLFFFTRMSCSIVLFLFCSLKKLFNFIVFEFSFFIKKIFSFEDNLNFLFYIIPSRENYSLA